MKLSNLSFRLYCIYIVLILLILNSTFGQENIFKASVTRSFPDYAKCYPEGFNYIPKKPGHYSRTDWQTVIDSTWGEGLPTAQKLTLFLEAWNKLNAEYAAFQGLDVNWDSIKTIYVDEISGGVSKGRFAAIMNYMSLALQEYHTIIWDNQVMMTPLDPGVPIFYFGGNAENTSHFGATLTPLADSTLLVLKTVPNHPLDLQPGDIVLGYDGILWKDIMNELLEAQLPLYVTLAAPAGDKNSLWHNVMCGAGMNWHLFDTIDIKKYSTGEILHFPTSLLAGIDHFIWGNEQLNIPGVEWIFDGSYNLQNPNAFGDYISWGVVEGTNIGYIYAVAWGENDSYPGAYISQQFYDAINNLMNVYNVDGLIIDQRLNYGGRWQYEYGLSLLFNTTFRLFGFDKRGPDPNNHFQMVPETQWDHYLTTHGDPATLFDRPIAMLIGPAAVSCGDMFPTVLRTHPMARLFGKPTNGSFSCHYGVEYLGGNSNWPIYHTGANGYMLDSPGNYLSHKAIVPDEQVWFSQEAVANGQDDVVNRALEWINNLVYPHNISTDTTYYIPGAGSVLISADVENPNAHQISARGYIYNKNDILIDSVDLIKQSTAPNSEYWWGSLNAPSFQEIFKLSVTVYDENEVTSITLPNAARFTTAGPVVLDSISILRTPIAWYCRPFITNLGDSALQNVSGRLICNDPWVTNINPSTWTIETLDPGISTGSTGQMAIGIIDSLFLHQFNFEVELGCENWSFWNDKITVGIEEEQHMVPYKFALDQNYPNPFNPGTKIKYTVPQFSQVQIKVYDVLGNEIETLISEEKAAGTYELNWNAANLPSGVYFYQIRAGEFTGTRKMILLK